MAKLLRPPPGGRRPVAGGEPLAGLVDVLAQGKLPRVSELDPYTLGATRSGYGDIGTYGRRDKYVPRAAGRAAGRCAPSGPTGGAGWAVQGR